MSSVEPIHTQRFYSNDETILWREEWKHPVYNDMYYRVDGPCCIIYYKNGKIRELIWNTSANYRLRSCYRVDGPVRMVYNDEGVLIGEVWALGFDRPINIHAHLKKHKLYWVSGMRTALKKTLIVRIAKPSYRLYELENGRYLLEQPNDSTIVSDLTETIIELENLGKLKFIEHVFTEKMFSGVAVEKAGFDKGVSPIINISRPYKENSFYLSDEALDELGF